MRIFKLTLYCSAINAIFSQTHFKLESPTIPIAVLCAMCHNMCIMKKFNVSLLLQLMH